jgi:hypothetical protein
LASHSACISSSVAPRMNRGWSTAHEKKDGNNGRLGKLGRMLNAPWQHNF